MYYDERNNYFDYISEENNNLYDIKSNKYMSNLTNNSTKNYMNESNYDIGNINIYNYNRHMARLVSPTEGFNKGNMFADEYRPYKNYYYKVVVRGKRDELLLKIQELTFAVIDLNLYLDLHPSESGTLEIYKNYAKELNNLRVLYEREFGPIAASDVTSSKEFTWVNNPWPWDNKGGMFNV
jgi:spore coat protein JB